MAFESGREAAVSSLLVPVLAFLAVSAAGVYVIYLQRWGLVFELAWVLLVACVFAVYLDRVHLR